MLVVLLDLRMHLLDVDDVAGNEREKLVVVRVDRLRIVGLGELEWGVIFSFGYGEASRVEDASWP